MRRRLKTSMKSSLNRIDLEAGERLSGHSHLLNGWIQGGVLGVLFWITFLKLVLSFLRKSIFLHEGYEVLFLILIFNWLWDYFFSPFAFRVYESVLIAVLLSAESFLLSNE